MIVFEGLFKLVGHAKRGSTSRHGIPSEIIAKAEAELDELVRLRAENAQMRKLLDEVVTRADLNLSLRPWPFKYAAPWGELARINNWLKDNPK